MNYPIWQLDFFGGGFLIAAIAVFHVYIAHFAVGGGLFLVLTELKGYRDNNNDIIGYVKKHARFFLLVTMVAGGITGVGIWFTIALLNPAATSVLIHTFVFGWATEWVFFFIEIVALFIYYYTFGKTSRRHHLIMGWIYFGAAWMSLFIINGIIDFMLTPGSWLENRSFWSGFFNPTFWPALAFRTFFSLLIAGLFGFVTACWIKNPKLRISMTRYCALWLLLPFALFIGSAYWYKASLPADVQELIFQHMPAMVGYINGFMAISSILVLGGLLLAIKMPAVITRPIAVFMLICGLMYMGCFEFIREGGRRPFIIYNHMYSTSIFVDDMKSVNSTGILKQAKWTRNREITSENRLDAGRDLYNILCLSCHAVGGPMHDIKKLTADFTPSGLDAMISGMDIFHPYMPPYAGTEEERAALAYYIAYGLNGRLDPQSEVSVQEKGLGIPLFDAENNEYVLLAWNTSGMHTISDTYRYWSLAAPGNTLRAQLILRGETPEIVTEDVEIHYEVETPFATPANHVYFWSSSSALFGPPPAINTGLTGNGPTGRMAAEDGFFTAEQVPVVPYPDQGGFDPYPVVTLKATNSDGDILATTKVTAPVSTEMGCYQCHGGRWKVDNKAGFTQTTASNILKVHDRLSGTDLLEQALAGSPQQCRSCHGEQAVTAQDAVRQLNLSASIHGFHANFLKNRSADACALCHPSSPEGATQSLRGIHNEIGLDCTSCHGLLEDHSIGLLKAEAEQGKTQAARLMKHLQPQSDLTVDEIAARSPWVNQPDCLGCHEEFEQPETDTIFNQWTESGEALFSNRTDESGSLFCAACHSSPHAEYPAVNGYGQLPHNIQPLQYQGNTLPIGSNMNCRVCHTIDMEEEMHHPNMLREFRNQ